MEQNYFNREHNGNDNDEIYKNSKNLVRHLICCNF